MASIGTNRLATHRIPCARRACGRGQSSLGSGSSSMGRSASPLSCACSSGAVSTSGGGASAAAFLLRRRLPRRRFFFSCARAGRSAPKSSMAVPGGRGRCHRGRTAARLPRRSSGAAARRGTHRSARTPTTNPCAGRLRTQGFELSRQAARAFLDDSAVRGWRWRPSSLRFTNRLLRDGEQRAGDARPWPPKGPALRDSACAPRQPMRPARAPACTVIGTDATLLQQRLVNRAIVLVVQQDAIRLLSVTAGAAGFLDVLLERCGRLIVDDVADVGLVDAEAKPRWWRPSPCGAPSSCTFPADDCGPPTPSCRGKRWAGIRSICIAV